MDDVTQFLEQFARQQQQRKDATLTALRSTILPVLAQAGVARVVAEYSGYGDSGAIDRIAYLDAQGQPVSLPGEAAVATSLENALYEFLPGGFEINEGGQGTLTLNVKDGNAVLHHEENVTEVIESSREFDL